MYHGDAKERREELNAKGRAHYHANREKCKAATDRWKANNKVRHRMQQRAWYLANREWQLLLARIGKRRMTLDQYAALDERQDWVCAICGSDEEMHIDHDHKTNRVRGILCKRCNLGIGHFRDNPVITESAASYLKASV